jgi:hypothetical protein
VVDIDKDILAPEAISDLLAGDQLPPPLNQQDEQLHRNFFQAQVAFTALQPKTGLIKCELAEMEFLGRTSPRVRWA